MLRLLPRLSVRGCSAIALLLPNSVFIHVPKTGGHWVAAALARSRLIVGGVGPVHASPDELQEDMDYWRRDSVFGFVRHPLTWYRSIWSHRSAEQWQPITDEDWFSPRWLAVWADFTAVGRSSETFEGFVLGLTEAYPDGFYSELVDTYTSDCTSVGRFESLAEDLVVILRHEPAVDVQRIRATRPRNVRGSSPLWSAKARYGPELARRVLTVERDVVRRFGYADSAEVLDAPAPHFGLLDRVASSSAYPSLARRR